MLNEMLPGVLLMSAIIAVVYIALGVTNRLPRRAEESSDMARKVADLEATVKILRTHLEAADARIMDLEARVTVLAAENAELRAKNCADTQPALPLRPLLVIGGTEPVFLERDQAALERARVPHFVIEGATQAMVVAELRRRRQDGTLYPWLLVSAHAGDAGVMLADGIASPEFWRKNLTGIDVVVLGVCKGSAIADELAGRVKAVVYFAANVPNEQAADFSYAFWRRMLTGSTVDKAFEESMREVPAVAKYVDMRKS